MVTRPYFCRRVRVFTLSVSTAMLLSGLLAPMVQGQRRQVAARTISTVDQTLETVDVGATPVSLPMRLTLRLAPAADRAAALDQLLASQTTVGSPSYHHWITPQQFAASYGASDEQLSATTAWLQAQGLSVDSISPARTRISVSGTADQVQRAFTVSLRNYAVGGSQRYASPALPSMPLAVASTVAEISGLDNLPASSKTKVMAISAAGLKTVLSSDATDPIDAVASAVDANTAPIITVTTSECTGSQSAAEFEAYRVIFRQASAQGITVITSNACDQSVQTQTGNLADATAVVTAPLNAAVVPADPRPSWQAAPGLPKDALRHSPDLTTSSVDDFANAMTEIVQQSDGRQGNVNATLYSLASTPDLYSQADGASGTWEQSTGLGTVNLKTLVKVFPRATGAISTTTALVADNYTPGYGTPITLTATITPASYATANPTGTVTFTSAQGTIGSSQLSNGKATFTVSTLDVGTYSVTATYSGDSSYAGSASTSNVVITVTIVNATLTAVISPQQNVPYGSTATITATVSLPNAGASPTGTVSAQVQGITGAVYTATLSPNPGGNTATANINIDAPPPQTNAYTVQVTCAGNQDFQCQAPKNLTFTTAKGNTNTTLSLTPSAPQAGQPVTLTAIINNNGNGKLTYNFSGNVSFYDNGKLIATAPVATNQASTSQALSGNVQHSIVAKYSGDANWNTSTSSPQAVQPILLPSTLTLTSNTSTGTSLAGVNLILTATVFTTATNAVGPTGNVVFYDTFNGSVIQLGTATAVIPNGPNQSIAIFTSTGLLAGTHSIYAIYGGDANFNTATSSTLPMTIADFTLTKVPQTLTLKAGQTGKAVILLGMVGGFNGTVTFGCTPPPNSETTCSFNPVTLTGGGSTTLQITTTAATTQTASSGRLSSDWNLFGGSALAALFWFVAPRRRTALSKLLLLLAAVAITANIGCGAGKNGSNSGSGSGSTTDPGTPLGTQTFTITTAGSDGVNTVRHTDQYQVTIQ
ncbi:MAG: Ig-like domain repeat protein [Acidobacteria bacterium]|nr:Ig-like domain repeat protein [Acidobacteriota bacterium]